MACCAAPRQSDDSQNFHGAAEARHGKGGPLINCAEDLRGLASGVAADQSGHLIDGFCGWCTRTAGEYVDQADEFFAMARVTEEVGRLCMAFCEDRDEIDRRAHEEIQRIPQSMPRSVAPEDWKPRVRIQPHLRGPLWLFTYGLPKRGSPRPCHLTQRYAGLSL
jgi:hypothetical protein